MEDILSDEIITIFSSFLWVIGHESGYLKNDLIVDFEDSVIRPADLRLSDDGAAYHNFKSSSFTNILVYFHIHDFFKTICLEVNIEGS